MPRAANSSLMMAVAVEMRPSSAPGLSASTGNAASSTNAASTQRTRSVSLLGCHGAGSTAESKPMAAK
eukprot:2881986-Lingulodinium_polyedra.AAC.1